MLEKIYLSRLQHYLYCPRQFALIELEGQWQENRFTAEGQVLHKQVNEQDQTRRANIRVVHALPLASEQLGIEGVADVVEFHRQPNGTETPFPIEYKRGKPKAHHADEVQLCAQALCLEEMLGIPVLEGALFYGETRRRLHVVFNTELREMTRQSIGACRAMIRAGQIPPPIFEEKKCRGCSLLDVCQPSVFSRRAHVREWLDKQIRQG